MTDRAPGLLSGPRFDPEASTAAAIQAEARRAIEDQDTDWRAHHIGAPAAPQEAHEGRRIPLPADEEPPSPFQGFLRDMAAALEGGDMEGEGRTELEISLYYLDRSTGQDKWGLCTKRKISPEECARHGMPDLESLALEYAMEAGPWGSYKWNIRGWVRGEASLATSQRITLIQPPGWKPREATRQDTATPAQPNPLDQLTQTISVARTMREALGLGGGQGGMDPVALQAATTAAEMRARYEMGEAHRKEVDKLRDDHRREVDKFRDEVNDLKRQLQEKDFELRSQPMAEDAGPLDAFLAKLEPGTVNSLLAGVAAKMMQPTAAKPAPARVPARTREDLKPRPGAHPQAPGNVQPLQTLQRPAALPEPRRAEAVAAVSLLAEASQVEGDGGEHDEAIRAHLRSLTETGMADGALGAWWKTVTGPADPSQPSGPSWLDYAAHRLAEAGEEDTEEDTEEGAEPMDFEALKAQLIARLDEGATDEAILEELRTTLSPDHLGQLRELVGMAPEAALGWVLGAAKHQERLVELRRKLMQA